MAELTEKEHHYFMKGMILGMIITFVSISLCSLMTYYFIVEPILNK